MGLIVGQKKKHETQMNQSCGNRHRHSERPPVAVVDIADADGLRGFNTYVLYRLVWINSIYRGVCQWWNIQTEPSTRQNKGSSS